MPHRALVFHSSDAREPLPEPPNPIHTSSSPLPITTTIDPTDDTPTDRQRDDDLPLPEELDVGRGLHSREARVLNLDGLSHGSLQGSM